MPIQNIQFISIWLKIALACMSVGVLLFIIGFSTDSWMEAGRYDSYNRRYGGYQKLGLWRTASCDSIGRCGGGKYRSIDLEDFHRATQAMECLALIAQLLGFLLLILYICVNQCKRRNVMMATIVLIFVAVLCMVIGFIVFAVKYEERGYDVAWSLGVAIAGCILIFIAGFMCVMHICAK